MTRQKEDLEEGAPSIGERKGEAAPFYRGGGAEYVMPLMKVRELIL